MTTAALSTTNLTRAPTKLGARWRFIGAGVAYVWRFGELDFTADSGRLLLRGENGTGKTTALETLWPFLLDLNTARLAAGKGRTTNFPSLMREAVRGAKRAYGYVWFTVCDPAAVCSSFGARLEFSESGSPPVTPVPFRIRGRPLVDLQLKNADGSALTADQFRNAVVAAGGEVFDDDTKYKHYLSLNVFENPDSRRLDTLAARIRDVRNPSNLLDLSPDKAAEALRVSLPGVAAEVIDTTATALDESAMTRIAFARDAEAADLLKDFADTWAAHAAQVLSEATAGARDASQAAKKHLKDIESLKRRAEKARGDLAEAIREHKELTAAIKTAKDEVETLERSEAYREHGRLAELKDKLIALRESARTSVAMMASVAREAHATTTRFQTDWRDLSDDLSECAARAAEAEPTLFAAELPIRMSASPRTSVSAGDTTIDAGSRLIIHGEAALREKHAAWEKSLAANQLLFDTSALALKDFDAHVEPVAKMKVAADADARDASLRAERDQGELKAAESDAAHTATALRQAITDWTRANPSLADEAQKTPDGATSDEDGEVWSEKDVDRLLAHAEPAQTLEVARRWQRGVLVRSERAAATLRGNAGGLERAAKELDEAAGVAEAKAAELRAGKLLPLPRPEWAGPSEDARALGAALEWQPTFTDEDARARVECALIASGLLGATLDVAGATSTRWRVEAIGPAIEPNLGAVVAVDEGHPLQDVAMQVLARVQLRDTAASIDASGDACIGIGRDGTFRAGVLRGDAVPSDAALPPATHVGARRRHAAALAEAERLEGEARVARGEAEKRRIEATALAEQADEIARRGSSFPSLDSLQHSEARRAAAGARLNTSERAAQEARDIAAKRAEELRTATAEWAERARGVGLPTIIDDVSALHERTKNAAALLRAALQPMQKLLARLDRILSDVDAANTELAKRLLETETIARTAHDEAQRAATAVRVLDETAGAAIREVLERIEQTKKRIEELKPDEATKGARVGELQGEVGASEALFLEAEGKRAEIIAKAETALQSVRALTAVSGISDALMNAEPPADGDGLIAQLDRLLTGRRTLNKRALRERHDAVRPRLAGIWSLDPGDDCGDLLTYVVAHHQGDSYSPPAAAARALVLKERAEKALKASEEKALADFVIGRLPGAITTAWIQLRDWRREVNKKMREAAASSGVTVQIALPLRELNPQAKTIYELTCEADALDLTDEQKVRLGDALYSLIHGNDGMMKEKVEAAVDIRQWVDVVYQVIRPVPGKPNEQQKPQPWNSRTGLSSGERRLVVLAPMLAALAGAYDQYGPRALRFVALDEVPAEVDERGKEGLARFIAALDLDVICTSHVWDGCPNAWDIDAHDMESSGDDGTVVANPMLIRGIDPLPSDEPLTS